MSDAITLFKGENALITRAFTQATGDPIPITQFYSLVILLYDSERNILPWEFGIYGFGGNGSSFSYAHPAGYGPVLKWTGSDCEFTLELQGYLTAALPADEIFAQYELRLVDPGFEFSVKQRFYNEHILTVV